MEFRSTARLGCCPADRARDVKVYVNPPGIVDSRVNFIFEPVFRNFTADNVNVIRETATEISISALKAKTAFGSA